jgi:cytochrome b subunit of formate dehydrogenase
MSGEDNHDHSEIDLIQTLKIIFIFVITGVVYLALIPAFSSRCRKSHLTLSLMNSLAGGVFLTMALVHILPEAVLQYEAAVSEDHGDEHRRML